MNPFDMFEREPLDRSKLSFAAKILVWVIEYVARIMAAFFVSIGLMFISLWPFKGASKAFFRVLGTVCDLYRSKYMGDEYHGK